MTTVANQIRRVEKPVDLPCPRDGSFAKVRYSTGEMGCFKCYLDCRLNKIAMPPVPVKRERPFLDSQWAVLDAITKRPGINIVQLEVGTGYSYPTVWRAMTQLVDRGLIEKHRIGGPAYRFWPAKGE